MKRPGYLIVWPGNLDSTKSRGQSRKLPQARAVRQPSLREVTQAATVLGYAPEPRERSAIPGTPWEKTGYVAVRKSVGRIGTLRAISAEIVKARQKEAQAPEAKREKR